MNLFKTKKLFSRTIAVLAISAMFYSCKCAKCLISPPPLNAYASDLAATNHLIDSSLSEEWINRYKTYRDSICTNTLYSQDSVLCNSEAFNKKYVLSLLCMPKCVGIRIYYGMDSSYKIHQIINGVDQHGNDLFYKYKTGDPIPKGQSSAPPEGTQLRVEDGMGCPKRC